eukprot:1720224-Amphidinium_carterae.2
MSLPNLKSGVLSYFDNTCVIYCSSLVSLRRLAISMLRQVPPRPHSWNHLCREQRMPPRSTSLSRQVNTTQMVLDLCHGNS